MNIPHLFHPALLHRKPDFYNITSSCLLCVMTVFMLAFAGKQSFWLDEMWQLKVISYDSIRAMLKTGLLENSPWNLPLNVLITMVFYRIMPYGEVYLLLPSILFTVLGIIALGKAGEEIGGRELGFYAKLTAIFSAILITQGAWELRPYAITFCSGSVMLYCLAKRLRSESRKTIAVYAAALLFFLYSHWFCSIAALAYGALDVLFVLKKKLRAACLLSYIAAGALFVPWFILMLVYHKPGLSTYWAGVPRIAVFVDLFKYLLSNSKALLALFFAGVFIAVFTCALEIHKTRGIPADKMMFVYMAASIAWTIGITFLYSKYINPKGSVFVNRYFFSILPQVFVFTALGLTHIASFTLAVNGARVSISVNGIHFDTYLFTALCLIMLGLTGVKNYKTVYNIGSSEPYRETAEYLSQQSDINDSGTLVIIRYDVPQWIEYYFIRRGFPLPSCIARGSGLPLTLFRKNGAALNKLERVNKDELLKYARLYAFADHNNFTDEFLKFLQQHYNKKDLIGARFALYTRKQ